MRKIFGIVLVVCLSSTSLLAQQPIPIRRILLYKNGMAYVVRSGDISAPLSLKFLSDEMNDVLKTLTAWNPDTSGLYPVGYTTGIAADQMLKRFPFDLRSPDAGLATFLLQIKGSNLKLELGSARSVSGQLIAIVNESRAVQPQTVVNDHRLTILTGTNVQTYWLSDVRSLELEDPTLSAALKSYLQVLSDGRQDVTRDVTVYPTAPGPINVAYVQQFPVWKTTYRIDLSKDANRIQGWSQIDNPTGEAWTNVDLTLVSGMPTSFTMNLYEPLYTSRQDIRVPASAAAAPRQYEAALDALKDVERIEPTQIRSAGPGRGAGVMGGVMQSMPAAPPPPQRISPIQLQPASGPLQTPEGARIDDYFEYRFPFPIQLGSRQSALLPFLNKAIEADRVSIYKSGIDRDHPLNGAWLKNNNDLPLEAGPITFFQNGKYAGETVLDYVSRGERRLVSYGVDYDIQAESRLDARPETVTRVSVSRGVLTVVRESVQNTTYRFRNKANEARTLVLEHPRDNRKVLKDAKPDETSTGFYRFRLPLAANQELVYPVQETLSREMTYSIRSIDRATFELTFSGSDLPAALRDRIFNIISQRERLAELQAQKIPMEASVQRLFADQERMRENLKALADGREDRALREKYIRQLDAQEQQVNNLRTSLDDLAREITEQEALISKLISELVWN